MTLSSVFAVGATTTTFEDPYDDGNYDYTYGGDANDYPSDGRCEVKIAMPGFEGGALAWVGSDLYLGSQKDVSMDADLRMTAYMYANGLWGKAYVKIYLECRNYNDESIEWSVKVYEWSETTGYSETWSNDDISLTLGDFPQSTPSGTWYFCVKIHAYGSWGGYFQYSSGSTDRAELYVDSIEVSY